MNSDGRITYWRKGRTPHNFGDVLSELLFDSLTRRSWFRWNQGRMVGDYGVVHLIGSVISNYHIEKDLEYVRAARAAGGPRIAFWGCGLRSAERPRPELMECCAFLGVRGPLTRDALGLPPDTAIGDPGLLMPSVYAPRLREESAGKAICVPHFLDKKTDAELLALSHCEAVLRPNLVGGRDSILAFIDALASARFVLAGALHAAIVAFAYKKPFAYFDSGYIDVPFKWSDFAASINMPVRFVETIEAGTQFFAQQSPRFRSPPLGNLLRCAPYRAPRRLLQSAGSLPRGLEQI